MRKEFFCFILWCGFLLLPYAAVQASPESAGVSPPALTQSGLPSVPAPAWQPLLQRLAADVVSGPDVDDFFVRLGGVPTQEPMGRQVSELYTSKF